MDLPAVRRALAERPPRHHPVAARQAAVALVLIPGRRGAEGLFIRRARHPRDPWSGQIGLPGGRREKGDAELFDTAVRETAEETGVRLTREHLLGGLDDVHPRSASLPDLVVRPFVFALPARPRLSVSDEVAYPIWLALEDLRAGAGTAYPRVRGKRLTVPCWRAGRHVVWGMTHRILTGLLDPAT